MEIGDEYGYNDVRHAPVTSPAEVLTGQRAFEMNMSNDDIVMTFRCESYLSVSVCSDTARALFKTISSYVEDNGQMPDMEFTRPLIHKCLCLYARDAAVDIYSGVMYLSRRGARKGGVRHPTTFNYHNTIAVMATRMSGGTYTITKDYAACLSSDTKYTGVMNAKDLGIDEGMFNRGINCFNGGSFITSYIYLKRYNALYGVFKTQVSGNGDRMMVYMRFVGMYGDGTAVRGGEKGGEDKVKAEEKRKYRKKFVIGAKYMLKGGDPSSGVSWKTVYTLKKFAYVMNGRPVGILIMKRDDGYTGDRHTISRKDCSLFHLKYEDGLEVFPMGMKWIKMKDSVKKH